MINIKNVSRKFRVGDEYIKALDRVSMDIKDGSFLAIMGPSGSGKTTLLNLIGGLDRPDSGEVAVEGKRIDQLKDRALSQYRNQTVGFVFQSFNLQPMYSALENVTLPLYFAKIGDGEKKRRALEQLRLVGLQNRIKHHPSQLSAGQRQRVAIARALVNNPKVILADEPTGNLDSKTGKEIMQLLKDLNKQKKVTILMVTHDDVMAQFADSLVHIRDGHVQR